MNETKLTKPIQLTEAIHQVHPIDNLRDLLDISFKKYPNNDAFRYKDKTTGNIISKTYEDVKHDVDSLGTAMLNDNLKNEKIMVISNNRYEWCITYLATVNGVGTIIPIDRELPNDEIITLVNKSEPAVVFLEGKFLDLFKSLKEQKVGVIKKIVCFDLEEDQKEEDILDFWDLISKRK